MLEILKLRLDGNFRPKLHDFNNKNTSLKIELAAAKFDAPWCTMFPLVAGGANAANVPQVAMRRCCVGRRVPPAACVMHNSLCKGISEPPVISVKDGDCYATFFVSLPDR